MTGDSSFFGPFGRHLGFRLVPGTGGHPECLLHILPEHLNKADVVHGGVIFGLGDTAMGALVHLQDNEEGATFLSTDVHVRYLRPSKTGELHARAEIDAKTRNTRVTSCKITCVATGELVAIMTGQFRRLT